MEIDVVGSLEAKKAFPECKLVMVVPPSVDELKRRLSGRGSETEEQIQGRLARMEYELSHKHLYDYIIVNDDFLNVQARLLSLTKSLVGAHTVTIMVERNKNDASWAIEHFKSFKNLFATGSCKDIASDRCVKHTFTNKTLKCRFVTCATESYDCNFILRLRISANNDTLIYELDLIRIALLKTIEEFNGEVCRIIDKLLHHIYLPSFNQS
jgi:hypothetical protein